MKANRKFLNGDDAVSPVIAVILMVAITVVLAATVYVWVSGFGSNSSQPAKSIAFTSDGAITALTANHAPTKTYTVASASPGMKFGDLTLKLDGSTMTYNDASDDATTPTDSEDWCVLTSAGACIASGSYATELVDAGDRIRLEDAGSLSGSKFLVLDAGSNSIILTLTVQ